MLKIRTNNRIWIAMVAFAIFAFSAQTHASLMGVTIDGGITSAGGGAPNCATTGSRVVNVGIEYTCQNNALQWDLDIGASTIELTITNTGFPGLNIGNSTVIALTDLFWFDDPNGIITSVSGPQSATITDHTFNVTVNGATPGTDTYRWSLTGSNPVPEPSIIALFAAGLFGLGFARRRKA